MAFGPTERVTHTVFTHDREANDRNFSRGEVTSANRIVSFRIASVKMAFLFGPASWPDFRGKPCRRIVQKWPVVNVSASLILQRRYRNMIQSRERVWTRSIRSSLDWINPWRESATIRSSIVIFETRLIECCLQQSCSSDGFNTFVVLWSIYRGLGCLHVCWSNRSSRYLR